MISLLFLCLSGAAHAQSLPPAPDPADVQPADDARARELFENGSLLYDEGRYEDAIAAWKEAWRLSGRALLLFNMANATERLGRYEEAMELLSRYRAFAPAEERETLDRRIRNIERRLDEVEAMAPVPAPLPPPVAATSGAAATGSVATVPKKPVRAVPLVLLGVGGASLVTGAVFGVRALGARADAAALCTPLGDQVWCPESAAGPLAVDRESALVADIGLGVGIGAVAGGLIGLLLPQKAPVKVALHVQDDGAMVLLGGTIR
ncbi:MAG: tetratricopeptide repeat protein [Pseudomonadota bacterium]|nr:tetratricopeptide repeat protein [Pseudomonadota bacterium]